MMEEADKITELYLQQQNFMSECSRRLGEL